ncbi:MAG: UDP-N-acetylmuramoyl-L-alanine--D-glutamate ligase [Firmicutes bacterium]|nr:UDP-N-acetylmuramoyl-L-alanine--D-glutamate ligase [Bacillota bacterium]
MAAVVGLGINNQSLVPFLHERGFHVIVADRATKQTVQMRLEEVASGVPVTLLAGADYLEQLAEQPRIDVMYLTPGMVKTGMVIAQLAQRGVHLTCETEEVLVHSPAPIIGITGSAGKTTTTTLTGMILQKDRTVHSFIGGNIGRSLLPDISAMQTHDHVIMELSSFQLELVHHSPHGAALLNITPNHLDMHGTFEAYQAAKSRIFRFQSPQDFLVVPWHDPVVDALTHSARSQKIYFSGEEPVPIGSFVQDGMIYWRNGEHEKKVISVHQLHLPGRHNVLNALAAIALVQQTGDFLEAAAEVLSSFQGVPHRLETVREYRGVRYINDSIATAPERTEAALKALQDPIVLIAGGYDKHLDYTAFGQAIYRSSVREVIVLGDTAEKIARAVAEASDTVPVTRVETFDQAVKEAARKARAGEIVLLSPASASYDMFRNFEERGQRFRDLVQQL